MSTKKKTAATNGRKVAAAGQHQIITVPAETVLASLKRFGNVCDFVEREMREKESRLPALNENLGRTDAPVPENPGGAGAEQWARDVRDTAAKTYALAAEISGRILYGGAEVAGKANECEAPTRGPIKDSLESTMISLDGITLCLRSIAEYIGL